MTTVTLNIPDDLALEISQSLNNRYPRKANQSLAQHLKMVIRDMLKVKVKQRRQAGAEKAMDTELERDFGQ